MRPPENAQKRGIVHVNRRFIAAVLVLGLPWLAACAPEVGSRRWCENMDKTPKGDWTLNEAREYARNCLFESDDGDDG